MKARERAFVDFFCGKAAGNASEAARLAGYKHPGQLGFRQLKKIQVQRAIAARAKRQERAAIMDAAERDELRSEIARDGKTHKAIRLRAVMDLDRVWRMRHGADAGTTWADVVDKVTTDEGTK